VKFAEQYNFPEGISFSAGWENAENQDLIVSTFKSLFIAMFLIFSILVFQFNSFKQPAIVLYSVILALLWVNIGLYLTGNPYSMPFMIWFIALTWVVVNDAIILIDRINKNLEKGIDDLHSIIGAGKSRLQPIIVTTLTTVFGVLPLALQDEFWAGLWFTIVFWLFAWSSMTLFVIPSLYSTIHKYDNKTFYLKLIYTILIIIWSVITLLWIKTIIWWVLIQWVLFILFWIIFTKISLIWLRFNRIILFIHKWISIILWILSWFISIVLLVGILWISQLLIESWNISLNIEIIITSVFNIINLIIFSIITWFLYLNYNVTNHFLNKKED
jgi:hypothetical protein